MSVPERVLSLLAAGEIAGSLMKLAKEVTPQEIHHTLRGDYGELGEPHRALLSVALAVHEIIENKARLIIIGKTPEGHAWISCPECGSVSHNHNDAAMIYCGHCRKFLLTSTTPEP